MNSIEKINYFIEELNELMSDEFLFPNWENNGSGKYVVKTNVDGDFKTCYIEYTSTIREGFIVLSDKEYSSADPEAFFSKNYIKLKRIIFFGKDTLNSPLDNAHVHISFKTLCENKFVIDESVNFKI